MSSRPFDMSNLVHLLEYLAQYSTAPPPLAEFIVRLTLDSDTNYDNDNDIIRNINSVAPDAVGNVQAFSMRSKVVGVAGVASLFQETPYSIEKIHWKGGVTGEAVRIDCLTREITLSTDSLTFTEICRHKLTGQRVRKFIVDLKIQ